MLRILFSQGLASITTTLSFFLLLLPLHTIQTSVSQSTPNLTPKQAIEHNIPLSMFPLSATNSLSTEYSDQYNYAIAICTLGAAALSLGGISYLFSVIVKKLCKRQSISIMLQFITILSVYDFITFISQIPAIIIYAVHPSTFDV